MIEATDFSLYRIQASAFVSVSGDEVRPVAALRYVLQEWGDVYDADPVALPASPQLPPELPLVVLSSRDQSQRMEIAPARVNVFWNRQNGEAPSLGDTLAAFAGRLGMLADQFQVTISRAAALITRLAEQENPGRSLAQQFCRDEWLQGPLNRPEGFELHAHKVFPLLPDVSVNSWIRVKTAQVTAAGYGHIFVEQDINTLVQEMETRRFSASQLSRWFREAATEMDTILWMYFPSRRA